jgi:EEF1A N-terminal glycine/lysine methyltransferase
MNEDEEDFTVIQCGDFTLRIYTAENDFNPGKKTLFATYIWSGSRVMADYLVNTKRDEIVNSSILELGSGTGIPSLICGKIGASLVCASDYASPLVLSTLNQNIQVNGLEMIVKMKEHIWATNIEELLIVNNHQKYDIVLASECLWKHEIHTDLLTSIIGSIKPCGKLIISYSHHIPGLEAQDDHFLTLAEEKGFVIRQQLTIPAPHMWTSEKLNNVFIIEFEYLQT